MINYTDYIFSLGLINLKQKEYGKWNARCNVCGDSEKSKSKTRLWFSPQPDGGMIVSCWNCGLHTSFWKYLKIVDTTLFNKFNEEQKREKLDDVISRKSIRRKSTTSNSTYDGDQTKFVKSLSKKIFVNIKENQDAVKYCKNRKIPKEIYEKFFWCKASKKEKAYGQMLIMPLYRNSDDAMYGFLGRSITEKKFHISLASKKNLKVGNLYNIDKDKIVYILESHIDSFFISNSISMLSASLPDLLLDILKKPVFCFDNDETGIRKSLEMAEKDFKVVIWPKSFTWKDNNEYIIDGHTKDDIKRILLNNTYSGIVAQMKLKNIMKLRRIKKVNLEK